MRLRLDSSRSGMVDGGGRLSWLLIAAMLLIACGNDGTAGPVVPDAAVMDVAAVIDVAADGVSVVDVPEIRKLDLTNNDAGKTPNCVATAVVDDHCTENNDCPSGWCVLHLGEKVCTQTCIEECPEGWSCEQMGAAGSDPTFICLSLIPSLCLPCKSSDDCSASLRCAAYPEGAGAFCGTPCLQNLDCPCGYECQEMPTTEGDQRQVCVAIGFECECTEHAALDHLGTTCTVSNEQGTCAGWRECEASGLSKCSAPAATPEECDGLDNDCDGVTDEDDVCDDCQCGDGDCNKSGCGECWEDDCWTCAVDCALCGNGTCDPGEGPTKCGIDCCGSCPDGVCKGGECHEDDPGHEKYCQQDCEFPCGNGLCEGGENPIDCPQDCEKYACGNGVCEPGEGPDICPEDCAASCGDCQCENGESYVSCPVDCGYCGDGHCIDKCEYIPEDKSLCPLDCDCQPDCAGKECGPDGCGGSCGTCAGLQDACVEGQCVCQPDGCGGGCGLCDDGDLCTDDICDGETGVCLFPDTDCDDGSVCTMDDCHPEAGCVYKFNSLDCDDYDPCTEDDVCGEGTCTGESKSCSDGLECTDDLCQPDGVCTNPLSLGYCLIDNTCHIDGTPSPENPCLACNAEASADTWFKEDTNLCGPLPQTKVAQCLEGVCIVYQCLFGFEDENGKPDDGCEKETNVIWVDASKAGAPITDGSFAYPYPTIKEAIVAVPNGGTLFVKDGTYAGGLLVNRPEITIAGESKEGVVVETPAFGTGLWITAQNVTVQNLTIQGGVCGVHFQGSDLSMLSGGQLAQIRITGIVGTSDFASGAIGVFVEHSEDVVVSKCEIDNVQGDSGGNAGGIFIQDSVNCWVTDSDIVDIKGSDANQVCFGEPDPWIWICEGSVGGDAVGIELLNCSECEVSGSHVETVQGGGGEPAASTGDCGGAGGAGYGIKSSQSSSFRILNNTITGIAGSWGGECGMAGNCPGTGGQAFGVSAYEQTDGTVSGNDIEGISGGEGGWSADFGASGGSAHGMLFHKADWVEEVSSNYVHQVTGGNGSASSDGSGGDGGTATGIEMADGRPKMWDNEVDHVAGGNGAQPGYWMAPAAGAAGGDAHGIRLTSLNLDAIIERNVVRNILGGIAGDACEDLDGCSNKDGGDGGNALGVAAVGVDGACTLKWNLILDITGGAGGVSGDVGVGGKGGDSEGLLLSPNSCPASNCTVAACFGGKGGEESSNPDLDSIPGPQGQGYGIRFVSGDMMGCSIVSSIVSDVQSYCVFSAPQNDEDAVTVSYSDLWDCGSGAVSNAIVDVCIGLDPIFMDPDNGDFHLHQASPCIDSGDLAAECGDEPEPNGCRVNMGAYGNTAEATSAPDAQHCEICPD
jgi:hypothetical protein